MDKGKTAIHAVEAQGQQYTDEQIVKKELKETEIDLTEAELEEITLTPEQEEELKKKILFAISKDNETGEVEICPMNEKGCITLHGAEEVKWFINRLWETIQS